MKSSTSFYFFFFLSFLFIGFFACKKDKSVESTTDFGYNYFPDNTGHYIIYQVDSIHYDDVNLSPHDTIRYLLKELIASTFLDNSGRQTLRMERYYKFYNKNIPYDSLQWTGPRVWYANKTSSTFEKVEENIRYIRLIFPVSNGKQWDGNVYNTLGNKNYEIISVDKPEIINTINFDSIVTVNQFQQIDFIQHRYEIEKFARNVGLIYKERDSIYHGGGKDTVGYTFTQKIISYKK
ncbi:MAG: hypothetical protein AABZ32_05045 [Bacteroidota bacterium]